MAYIHKVLIALDQFGSVVIGGKTDQTLSGRAGLARNNGKRWGCIVCSVLGFITRSDHCSKAIIGDQRRAEAEEQRKSIERRRNV